MQYSGNPRILLIKQRNFTHNLLYLDLTHLTRGSSPKQRRCVVMHDAPSFLFITDINRFIFFKLR